MLLSSRGRRVGESGSPRPLVGRANGLEGRSEEVWDGLLTWLGRRTNGLFLLGDKADDTFVGDVVGVPARTVVAGETLFCRRNGDCRPVGESKGESAAVRRGVDAIVAVVVGRRESTVGSLGVIEPESAVAMMVLYRSEPLAFVTDAAQCLRRAINSAPGGATRASPQALLCHSRCTLRSAPRALTRPHDPLRWIWLPLPADCGGRQGGLLYYWHRTLITALIELSVEYQIRLELRAAAITHAITPSICIRRNVSHYDMQGQALSSSYDIY